ncbi:ABC transporter ATP-binding protein [Ancylobacter sp. Lp-2]|uniref:ABC transporter ATP-binding protein n=1 Tax=Ancylobacter sp. Lp-2 TaxID=2881339 RepID=UPI001E2F86FB|nr:ABC transporter ATP-binding protein [Ancylobacter sp. Lp-2]MCB4770453.1 ABC transporter ATP-binding protein [Ancylobacter sp. Lp-2]
MSAAATLVPDFVDPRENATVRIRDVVRRFDSRTALDGISLDIPAGQFVALIGKSGSGKSTLLRAIADLDDDVEGGGRIDAPDNRSVLFQDSRLLPWQSVIENILLGVRDAGARARAEAVLADVGLAGRADAWPNQLSGGEQQRVALARSLVRRPDLLLADEPFGALDALTRLKMQQLLFRLVGVQRPTIVLVTHDVDEALILADRVLVMDEGRIVLDRPVGIAHPRRASDPAFATLRTTLLGALGVTETI